ncbi:MAG: M20 family metallopeptidase [Rectinemataceae bacterium]
MHPVASDIYHDATMLAGWLIQIRRQLHMIPELGNEEYKTSAFIQKTLQELGIPFETVGTGVVALLEGPRPGRVVAIRADMDALPIAEPENRPYASTHPGRMHACGHDAHMAIALGVARLLAARRDELRGAVRFLFQPAEETTGGALPLIRSGCLERPHVDLVLGLHVLPELPAGMVECKYGAFYGASDSIEIEIHGSSSHAAYPDRGVDAIVAAATVIQSLQTLISRSVSPLDHAVLTIGTIHGGTQSNILADRVHMTGTMRTVSESVREFLKERLVTVAEHTARALGASAEVRITPSYPVLQNHDRAVDLVRNVAVDMLGRDYVRLREKPMMGVEDFAYYLKERPGAFWHLGCGPAPDANRNGQLQPGSSQLPQAAPLHSPLFAIDEACLPLGVAIQAAAALRFLLEQDSD